MGQQPLSYFTFIAAALTSLATPDIGAAQTNPALRWNTPHADCINGLVTTDDQGRTYVVCGTSGSGELWIRTLSNTGTVLFERRYHSSASAYDRPSDVVWSGGKLFITGQVLSAGASDALTIGLRTPDLAQIVFVDRYDGPDSEFDAGHSIAVTPSGDVVVTGLSRNANDFDLLTLRYNVLGAVDATGELIPSWAVRYDSGGDDTGSFERRGIAIASNDAIYILGSGVLLAYSGSGVERWRSPQTSGSAVAIDHDGAVVVTSPIQPTGYTARYDASTGSELWRSARGGSRLSLGLADDIWVVRTLVASDANAWNAEITRIPRTGTPVSTVYRGPYQDRAEDIWVDPEGSAFVLLATTVRSGFLGTAPRTLLLKYNSALTSVWRFEHGQSTYPTSMAVAPDDTLIVADTESTFAVADVPTGGGGGGGGGCLQSPASSFPQIPAMIGVLPLGFLLRRSTRRRRTFRP